MKTTNTAPLAQGAFRRAAIGWAVQCLAVAGLTAVVIYSAVLTKQARLQGQIPVLAAVTASRSVEPVQTRVATSAEAAPVAHRQRVGYAATEVERASEARSSIVETSNNNERTVTETAGAPVAGGDTAPPPLAKFDTTDIRYFNGRPIRPVRTMWMVVTAYSPDERSCAGSADGITASLHHVETNSGKLVAADSRVLPLGSMVSVPGYDKGRVVPVLDRGGAIKGNRLDVLYPTHEQARRWGVRRIKVVVWDYADGEAHDDWRRIRDSRSRSPG
ncbi:MAG: hypothetical protein H7Y88_01305 [Phycisphaerales bacterium]|nr:hypothetical protein [Phycisphaerales bacterium]